MAKVTTGTGDDGYTGLLGGGRIPKYDPRPELLGTIDESTSMLGLARALATSQEVQELIIHVQRDLYQLMAEVATLPEHSEVIGIHITMEHTTWLEATETELMNKVALPNQFIIPGDTANGATLDVARTIIRRAERQAVRLLHDGLISNGEIIRYLNRCSDFIFVLARTIELQQGSGTLAAEKT
jgi:cob(I)alamin adenosyltransferase